MSFRASATKFSNASVTSGSITVPASVQAGDLLMLYVSASGARSSWSVSSSAGTVFTAVSGVPVPVGSYTTVIYTAIAGANDAGSTLNFNWGGAAGRWAALLRCDYDVTAALDGAPAINSSTSGTKSLSVKSVTPTAGNNGDIHVIFYGGAVNPGVNVALEPPALYTERDEVTTTHSSFTNQAVATADRYLSSASATPALTATSSEDVDPTTYSLLLVPLGGNQAPNANAGANQTVISGSTVTLNGSGSTDPDGSITGYSWRQISGTNVTLSSSTAAQPTFTAPTSSVLVFGLVVTDNGGAQSSEDTVTITVGVSATKKLAVGGSWVDKPLKVAKSGSWY